MLLRSRQLSRLPMLITPNSRVHQKKNALKAKCKIIDLFIYTTAASYYSDLNPKQERAASQLLSSVVGINRLT